MYVGKFYLKYTTKTQFLIFQTSKKLANLNFEMIIV